MIPALPGVSAAFAARDAALVRWGGADGYVLRPLFPLINNSRPPRSTNAPNPLGLVPNLAYICPTPTYPLAHVLGVAAGYVTHPTVGDGVLDVPLVGFYVTTPPDVLPGSRQRS